MNIDVRVILNYWYIRLFGQNKILRKIKKNNLQNEKEINKEIALAISTNSKFIVQAKIMLASLKNAGCMIKVYILNINLNSDEIESMKNVVPDNVKLNLIKVDKKILDKLKISSKWPVEAWARILIPKLIDEDMVIYLDVDTVIVDSLIPLIDTVITNPIAGVLSTYYFQSGLSSVMPHAVNSGVLVMHKKELNKLDFSDNILRYAKEYVEELQMPDQDSINMVCKDYMKNVVPRFNAMNFFYANTFRTISKHTVHGYYTKKDFDMALFRPAILHFNGGPFARPWEKKGIKHPYYKIYQYYSKIIKLN